MNTVLIIYPHWVPVNLAGVQRPRLIGNYLKEFAWQPVLLTVDPRYYEESTDPLMEKTVSPDIEVIYTKAFKLTKPRLIGDIGLRAFTFLKKAALKICKERPIDFIWIPIPSFYTAVLGRVLYNATKIPYGIDYIDPWVRNLKNQNNLRAQFSQMVARTLEPYAVKKAALITGVSTPYYWPVIERNFKTPPAHVGMPYGFDPNDHAIVLEGLVYPWDAYPNCKPWIYAGAFLPNSHLFLEALFKSIASLKASGNWDAQIRLYFLGTGSYPAKRITAYAKDYNLESIVTEQRERYPFLHILNFLAKAHRVLLLGSTEAHYTASKTFQCLLSKRPLLAVLNEKSSAVDIISQTGANAYLVLYREGCQLDALVFQLNSVLTDFQKDQKWLIDLTPLSQYTSKASAKVLAKAMNMVLNKKQLNNLDKV